MGENSDFTPLLTTADWGKEWKELQKARRAADDAAHWDERSKTYRKADAPSPYVDEFLKLASILPGEVVLDMGCGSGALAVPLAARHHEVIAADFSAGMLERTREECAAAGVTGVKTVQMSWADDWAACGIGPKSVDVALASRSIATNDLSAALSKLTATARRRACITLPTGSSPRVNERALTAIGLQNLLGRDHVYAFMILANAGYEPTVDYIVSERVDTYASSEDALASLVDMVRIAYGARGNETAIQQAEIRLAEWLETELVENEHVGESDGRGGIQKPWKLRIPQQITWAFIAWKCA